MKKLLPLILLFICFGAQAQNQGESLLHPGRVVFYNVENLFDTVKNPENSDDAFLPNSPNHWNTQKYQIKLEHISKVLAAMFDSIQPIAIGLAEVENQKVVEDLIAQPALKKYNFGVEYHDSPGPHGLAVALIYNKDVIQEVFSTFLRINFSFDSTDTTRDILYFQGFMTEEFPVYFFINHWPGNDEEKVDAEKKRTAVAARLRAKIEDIYLGDPASRIVIMGDFNEGPDGKGVQYLCAGKNKYPQQEDLIDLMRLIQSRGGYTLKNKSKGAVYDQMIVSKNLMTSDNPYYICGSAAHVFKPEWLLTKSPEYGLIPNSTYINNKWVGGYSDHLPVYIDICFH